MLTGSKNPLSLDMGSVKTRAFIKDAPQELLEKQIATLCCVLNPEAIGICSDVLKDIQISLPTIPLKHQPQIIKINQLYTLIKEGLFQIGKNQMIGETNNE